MNQKQLFIGATVIGGAIGGFIPLLWGAGEFSFSSVILTAVGGITGLYIAYKMTR